MRDRFLYARLAAGNIHKNGRLYYPYLLTVVCTVAAHFILSALSSEPDLPERVRYAYLQTYVTMGEVLVTLFAVVFLFYTNSFLMKRRKKEIALYRVLGMGRRNLAAMLGMETLYLAVAGLAGGLLTGALFKKLAGMLLYRLMGLSFYESSPFRPESVWPTAAVFCVILALGFWHNLRQTARCSPVELLRESGAGEREPKTRWFLALLGVAALGGGYGIALCTHSIMEAFLLYFVAVLLVAVGTYCLFTAGSIAALKLLRRNKRFYYRPGPFIGVSGMLYRMKRNAVGLANICILSTMVLVMVSGTLALYAGTGEIVARRYPRQLLLEAAWTPGSGAAFSPGALEETVAAAVESEGYAVEEAGSVWQMTLYGRREEGGIRIPENGGLELGAVQVTLLSERELCESAGVAPGLAEGEAYALGAAGSGGKIQLSFDGGGGVSFTLRDLPEALRAQLPEPVWSMVMDQAVLVVPDRAALEAVAAALAGAYPDEGPQAPVWRCTMDTSAPDGGTAGVRGAILDAVAPETGEGGPLQFLTVRDREEQERDLYAMNGGFFFLGVFLGVLFLMAAVLIIYYKQVSEGYEDRGNYQMMRKVGLSRKQIRRAVNGQILTVFFLPLLVAAAHVALDFRLMAILLLLFEMENTMTLLCCTAAVLAGFAVVYALVYRMTARAYYRIVSK